MTMKTEDKYFNEKTKKKYRVTAVESVVLETYVYADSPEEAIEQGNEVANVGGMLDVESSGIVDNWEAYEVTE